MLSKKEDHKYPDKGKPTNQIEKITGMDTRDRSFDVNEIQGRKRKNGKHSKDENLKNRRVIFVFVYEYKSKYH